MSAAISAAETVNTVQRAPDQSRSESQAHQLRRTDDVDHLATVEELNVVTGLRADEINKRIQDGNTCYTARLNGAPVAYGWVARSAADIGELELPFHVDECNAYLWDFQTVPEWRGRGI